MMTSEEIYKILKKKGLMSRPDVLNEAYYNPDFLPWFFENDEISKDILQDEDTWNYFINFVNEYISWLHE